MSHKLSPRVEDWREAGEHLEVGGRSIFVRRRLGSGPTLLLLHGFPSSSYDWRALLDQLPTGQSALMFDCLGFGLSDKPRRHGYTLFEQAGIAEELVGRLVDGQVFVVAHDMGTSVATELMRRDLDGRLGFELAGVLLLNGSIIVSRASLTFGQKLLRSPFGWLAAQLPTQPLFRQQFKSVFAPGHPVADDELDDQWALWARDGGNRIAHRLIGYVSERERHAERWHGAVREWPGPLSIVWGMRDPVATPNVLAGLRELRPHAPITELADLGHYLQIEDPAVVAEAIRTAQAGAATSAERPR
jgi:pimeloyl-ACP methyl ester carboxylesterase